MEAKRFRILNYLAAHGPATVDEFVTYERRYVNSWAPSFTYLKQDGLIKATGQKRLTSHGGTANVWQLTEPGREALAQEWGV